MKTLSSEKVEDRNGLAINELKVEIDDARGGKSVKRLFRVLKGKRIVKKFANSLKAAREIADNYDQQ